MSPTAHAMDDLRLAVFRVFEQGQRRERTVTHRVLPVPAARDVDAI